jgi:uncharacterized protein
MSCSGSSFWPTKLALLCGLLSAAPAICAAQGNEGPSFSCAAVTSKVNKLICAKPELAALDRELAEVFRTVDAQPSTDRAALRAEEDKWLADLRARCTDVACIADAYRGRIAALRQASAQAASPAAYDETRPFPAPDALVAAARSFIGKSCAGFNYLDALKPGGPNPMSGFFVAREAFLTREGGGIVFGLEKGGSRFAFLFVSPGPDSKICRIADVVVLPAGRAAVLECRVADQNAAAQSLSAGFGIRDEKTRKVVAYWEIDDKNGKLVRQPIEVLGWTKTMRCNHPEIGE